MAKQNPKEDFEDLPTSVAEFVKELIKKMGYRRKVREDVRAELTAHFQDALKDCRTDEEKNKEAKRLIAEFGDVKMLAILLRRAKKRCRPLWRTVVARTFQGIGVLLLCLVFYTIWFSLGEPTIRVDYLAMLNQMSRPELRSEDNAWPHYEKAISLYVPPSPVVEQFTNYRRNHKEYKDIVWLKGLLEDYQQEVSEWLAQNQKHWDNFTSEQQAVVLKCFEYNWVPFPKMAYGGENEWVAKTFVAMTEYVLRCIKEGTELTSSLWGAGLPGSEWPGFPEAELKDWLKNRKVPANFIDGVSVAVLHEAAKRYKNLPEDTGSPLTDVEYEYMSPWIEQNKAAWQQFVTGTRKQYYYQTYTLDPNSASESLWAIVMPHLRAFRDLSRLGIWRSRAARAQGKKAESIEVCLAVARAGSHWQPRGTLIEQLVGLAVSNLAHEEILRIAETQDLSAAELEKIQQQLSQLYAEGYPLMDIEGERLAFLDIVQRAFTEGGPGGGHLLPIEWPEWASSEYDPIENRFSMPLYTAASMVHAGRSKTIAKANQVYDQQAKLAKMTPYQRHVSDVRTSDELLDSVPRYRFFLIQIFMPAADRVSELTYRGKMLHEATLTVLAIRRWRLEKNDYPANLNELVAAGLIEYLPMDPCSDKPLVYKKTGDGFTLYSVGCNFTDDGGEPGRDRDGRISRWRDNGDEVIWPLPRPGE